MINYFYVVYVIYVIKRRMATCFCTPSFCCLIWWQPWWRQQTPLKPKRQNQSWFCLSTSQKMKN